MSIAAAPESQAQAPVCEYEISLRKWWLIVQAQRSRIGYLEQGINI